MSRKSESFAVTPKSKDLPATRGMLQLVRQELKSEMRAGFKKVDARFNEIVGSLKDHDSQFSRIDGRFAQIDARFNEVDARFNEVDARFARVDARFDQMDAKLETVISEVSRLGVLLEEQNANNRIVLEGLTSLWQRQERIETRTDDIEKLVHSIARAKA